MLETERLILRRWNDEDKIPFRKINSDVRVMEFYPSICTDQESDKIVENIEKHFEKNGFGLYAVELKKVGVLLGFVGLQRVPFESHFTPAIEIGWRISADYWGYGYAPEAAKAVLDFGFATLKIEEIVAMTVPDNFKSRRVMEKLKMNYDAIDDFENPKIPENHRLRSHVLYRTKRKQIY